MTRRVRICGFDLCLGSGFAALVLLAACAATGPHDAPPIAWRDWSAATFDEARAANRPVVVHVEAVWCHWCHVMERETYGDARVREVIAAEFVPVKVDSDARPDVAERFRDWGWPATGFLTPDGRTLLNLRGYQEADEFEALLRRVADDFRAGRAVVPPEPEPTPPAQGELAAVRDAVAAQLDGTWDEELAGWGARQKYPIAAPVEHAFLRAARRGDPLWRARALRTLGEQRNLIDPVWGGMYQYSIPRTWDRPHFEKILPVQAGALANYAEAYAATGDERWLRDAAAVRGYVDAFLRAEDGTFLASQDADVGAHGDGPAFVDGHDYFVLDDAARRALGIPRVDRNVYADRNGRWIAALCRLFAATGDDTARDDAVLAAMRLVATHGVAGGAFVHRAGDDPHLLHLADQVEMGLAFAALHEATADGTWLDRATGIARSVLLARFATPEGAFFAATEAPGVPGLERRLPFEENARAARLLLALHRATGDDSWRAAAERTLRALAPREVWSDEGRSVGDLLLALEEFLLAPVHLTVVGRPDDPAADRLRRAALAVHLPHRVVELSPPGAKYPDTGAAVVYVCTDRSCSPPVADPAALRAEVDRAMEEERAPR